MSDSSNSSLEDTYYSKDSIDTSLDSLNLNKTKSEEFINANPVKTKSGRISKPPDRYGDLTRTVSDSKLFDINLKVNLLKSKTSTNQDNNITMANIAMSDAQFNQIIQQFSAMGRSNLTTVLAENSLPKFRGKRKENEKHFDQIQTFSEFIDSVNAHITAQSINTDKDKINFLLICADKNHGDFYSKVCEFKNLPQYSDSTYQEIVNLLRAIYATDKEKTLVESNREIISEGTKPLTSRNLLSSRLNAFHTAQENSIRFYLESETLDFPVQDNAESNADFANRCNKFKAELIRDFNFKLFFGTKFTPSVNKKLFMANEMNNRLYKDTVLKLHEIVRETPVSTSIFLEESKKKNVDSDAYVVETPTEGESEDFDTFEYPVDNMDDDFCETYYSHNHRGNNRSSYRGYSGNSGRFFRPMHARRSIGESHSIGRGNMGRGFNTHNSDGKSFQHASRGFPRNNTYQSDRGFQGNYRGRIGPRGRGHQWRKYSPVNYNDRPNPNTTKVSGKNESHRKPQ